MLDYQTVKSPNQKNIVILLHGYGSHAYDIISIAPLLKLPDTTFIAPTAPLPSESGVGFMWFPLETGTDGLLELKDLKSLIRANRKLTQFIKAISVKFNTNMNKIALLGFSQGGIISLFQALHSKSTFASVVSHSTAFYDDPLKISNLKQNILLIHGKEDDVLPYSLFEKTKNFLTSKNIKFSEFSKNDMGHNIDTESMQQAEKFFLKHFQKNNA